MWVKSEVEDLPCWDIVDIGASISLISRHMASLVGKPAPTPFVGPIGNVMPIDGNMLAEVTFGKHKSTDELIVVDELYPHVLIGVKILCDNKCQFVIEDETLKIRKRDQTETTVPLYVGDRLEPPTDQRAWSSKPKTKLKNQLSLTKNYRKTTKICVKEIVELVASDLQESQIKEKLSSLIGIFTALFCAFKRSPRNCDRDGTF